MKTTSSVGRRILLAGSITVGALVAGCLLIFGAGYLVFGRGTRPEVQLLTRIQSPGGQMEARLLRIIGGPPMGGAVVWQEIHLVSPGTPVQFVDWKANPGLVLSISDESEIPAAKILWKGPSHLLVESAWIDPSKTKDRIISGVTVDLRHPWRPETSLPLLSSLADFPPDIRQAATSVYESIKAKGEPPEEFRADVKPDGTNVLVFHLWHESAMYSGNRNAVGNPGGKCRDVLYDTQSRRVTGTFFWK